MTAYLAGVATPFAAWAAVIAAALAAERTGYSCRCGWSTGLRAALPAWLRYRWHRHVTRSLRRRCSR